MLGAQRNDAPELAQVTPHRVDAGGAGVEVPLAQTVKGDDGLLDQLHRHALEVRVARGFEQRFSVGAIGLVAIAVTRCCRQGACSRSTITLACAMAPMITLAVNSELRYHTR